MSLPIAELPGASRQNGLVFQVEKDGVAWKFNLGDLGALLTGSGYPGDSGIDGDVYIDTSSHALYGPKSSGDWGAPVSLIGPQSETGADGKTVLNGATDPDDYDGMDGDFYVNTAAHTFFGPKSTHWSAGFSLVGSKGDKGDKGDTGDSGADATNYIIPFYSLIGRIHKDPGDFDGAEEISEASDLSGTYTGSREVPISSMRGTGARIKIKQALHYQMPDYTDGESWTLSVRLRRLDAYDPSDGVTLFSKEFRQNQDTDYFELDFGMIDEDGSVDIHGYSKWGSNLDAEAEGILLTGVDDSVIGGDFEIVFSAEWTSPTGYSSVEFINCEMEYRRAAVNLATLFGS